MDRDNTGFIDKAEFKAALAKLVRGQVLIIAHYLQH